MLPPDAKTAAEVIRKLKRLKGWTDHFRLDTWLPDLIEIIEAGKLTEAIVFTPPAPKEPANGNDAEKKSNTQNSAHQPAPTFSPDELIAHCFREAHRHYDEAEKDDAIGRALRSSALIKGKLSGGYLNRAKDIAEDNKLEWLPLLAKGFGEEKIRTCQVFMQIAREWKKIEPELEKNPNLSIDGALQVLRGKERKKPLNEEDRKRKWLLDEAKKILQRAWPVWSSAEINTLHENFQLDWDDEFQARIVEVMNWLRWRVRRHDRISYLANRRKRFKGFFTDEELCRHDWN